jgi:aspartyl-tRNA(Asn)/glutamyl-tRNA(Gln) amidotransferase subunit B
VRRQVELIEDGGKVVQETRLFDPDRGETRPMRSKEDAQDYRYFPDPDLLPLEIAPSWIDDVRRAMPALPEKLRHEFVAQHGLAAGTAALLTESREKADFFVATVAGGVPAKTAANWINGEYTALLNDRGGDFAQLPVDAARFSRLLALVGDGSISGKAAKEVLQEMAAGTEEAQAIVARRGLAQISDAGAIESAVDKVLAAQAKLVEDYRAGKDKAFNALVGQVMKATQGKANPQEASRILRERLER